MTRNIFIAALFSLLTAAALGFIFLREAQRLPEATAAIDGEQLERGARDFEQYCANCHGMVGQGGVAEGAPSINDITVRYFTPGADGVALFDAENGVKDKYGTLSNYIEATLYSGVRGAAMPAFGAQGTLREDQIRNITAYVLSWNGKVPEAAKVAADLEATRIAPTPDPNANPVSQGEAVFKSKGCAGCHNINDQNKVGPGLGGLFQAGGTAAYGEQLPNGEPINDDTVKDWILKGTAGFPNHIDPLIPGLNADGTYPPMPGIPVSDEEYTKLLVWLKAHNRDGSLTAEAQAQKDGGEQPDAQPAEGDGQTSPQATVQPTGQANPATAPDSEAPAESTTTAP